MGTDIYRTGMWLTGTSNTPSLNLLPVVSLTLNHPVRIQNNTSVEQYKVI